jgi:hypothetical protein
MWDDFELVNACEAAFPQNTEVLLLKNGSIPSVQVNVDEKGGGKGAVMTSWSLYGDGPY